MKTKVLLLVNGKKKNFNCIKNRIERKKNINQQKEDEIKYNNKRFVNDDGDRNFILEQPLMFYKRNKLISFFEGEKVYVDFYIRNGRNMIKITKKEQDNIFVCVDWYKSQYKDIKLKNIFKIIHDEDEN